MVYMYFVDYSAMYNSFVRSLVSSFYSPGMKNLPEASFDWIVYPNVCLSLCSSIFLSAILFCFQSAIFMPPARTWEHRKHLVIGFSISPSVHNSVLLTIESERQ